MALSAMFQGNVQLIKPMVGDRASILFVKVFMNHYLHCSLGHEQFNLIHVLKPDVCQSSNYCAYSSIRDKKKKKLDLEGRSNDDHNNMGWRATQANQQLRQGRTLSQASQS
jgi:hypothetical protein